MVFVPRYLAAFMTFIVIKLINNLTSAKSSVGATEEPPPIQYGVDVSFPMHYPAVSTNYPWLPHNVHPENIPIPEQYLNMPLQPLGDMQKKYDDYIQGCVDYYNRKNGKGKRCLHTEQDRIAMTLRQPQSMRNYTSTGFLKIRAPDHVFQLLKDFYEKNRGYEKPENWAPGNIYVNHWQSPSYMLSVEDSSLEGGGYVLKQHIWNAARDTMEEWTGYRQAECSLYGIRIYTEGAILSPHVDRLPLVSSAIINVDQDVDEPWPLEVIGHDGIARNVTMVPGDLVLYESHSIIHSRPFPLKGRFMANVFIHFEPVQKIGGAVEYAGDLPPYLIPGSPEEPNWRRSHPNGHKLLKDRQFTTGSTEAHQAASAGDFESLQNIIVKNPSLITVRDKNGWTPLMEAVRRGDLDSVAFLLERGSEMNARYGSNGDGGSVLFLAKTFHGDNHPVVSLLESRGAKHYLPHQEL